MGLFNFEIKKILTKKIVIVSFIIFLLLDVVKIGFQYNQIIEKDPLYEGKQGVIHQIEGPITNEKISFVIEKKNELDELIRDGSYSTQYDRNTYSGYQFGDQRIFNELYHSLDYAYHYKENLNSVQDQALENISLFSSNTYEVRKSKKIIDVYRDREITEFYDTVGFDNYLKYDFSTLLILLLIILIISPIFAEEVESGMNLLVYSSPKGRTATVKVKLAVCLFIAIVIPIIFCCTDYLVFSILFHFEGGMNPLYSIESFMYTPFNGTINQYVILSGAFKVMGAIFFSLLFAIFSFIQTHVLSAFLYSVGALLFSIISNDFFGDSFFNKTNPITVFTNSAIIDKVRIIGVN